MNYHRNLRLSTFDRDNDNWDNNCAARASSFGWYNACCNLCMITATGSWPGGSTPYHPCDWQSTDVELESVGKVRSTSNSSEYPK